MSDRDIDSRLIDYAEGYRGDFPTLEKWFPYAGPCLICGGPDKRHRLWDCVMDFAATGDTAEQITDYYQYDFMPVEAVREVIRIQPYRAQMMFHLYGLEEDEEAPHAPED